MLVGCLVIGSLITYVIIQKYQRPPDITIIQDSVNSSSSAGATTASVKSVVANLGRLIVLPTQETPVLIVVKDPAKLQDIAFMRQTAPGDEVLIYRNLHQGYIYRPSVNLLIAVGKVNLQ